MERVLELNNEGVKLLERGSFGGAAKRFRQAFENLKLIVGIPSTNRFRTTSSRSKIKGTRKEDKLPDRSRTPIRGGVSSRSVASMEAKAHTGKRIRVDDDNDAAEADPSKNLRLRRRRQKKRPFPIETKAKAALPLVECGVLGRPLWLASSSSPRMTTLNALNACGSSILYNYAFSLQRLRQELPLSMNESWEVKKRCLWTEAVRVYDEAIRLSARGNSSPVVQWISCHNKQILLVEQDTSKELLSGATFQQYQELESVKIDVIRTVAKGSSSSDRSFLFVLSMLGIEGNERHNRPAPVA